MITTKTPTLARSTRRALALFGVPTLALWANVPLDYIDRRISGTVTGVVVGAYLALGVMQLLYASTRIAGKRSLWDRFGGTMVRYRTTRTAAK